MRKTDPYKYLEFAVGDDDTFVCFDYEFDGPRAVLHAVINSETGGFIDRFEYVECDASIAPEIAEHMVYRALDCLAENGVTHDVEGWNQDAEYFIRAVKSNGNAERILTQKKN